MLIVIAGVKENLHRPILIFD